MIGIDFREKTGPALKALMEEHGVLALPAGSTVLRLLPPLTLSEAEIEIAVQAIATVLPVSTSAGPAQVAVAAAGIFRSPFGNFFGGVIETEVG